MKARARERFGERIDFEDFVRDRSAVLFRTAYLLTSDRHAAEDLVQEALEKACRHWRRISAVEAPEAYVRQIVVNLANDRWRRMARADESAPVPDQPESKDPYQHVDLRDELVAALRALPVGMRTVVVLHYLHDLDEAQIAAEMEITPSTVRSQLGRALAKLRATADAQPHAARHLHQTDLEGTR